MRREAFKQIGMLDKIFTQQQFPRINALKRPGNVLLGQFLGIKSPGRHISPGQSIISIVSLTSLAAHKAQRGQEIIGTGVQKAIFGQCSLGHNPDHIARHQGLLRLNFCFALAFGRGFGILFGAGLGLLRGFNLLANRDLIPRADQTGQIGFMRVMRHPGHWDGLTIRILAAFGQGNIENLRGRHRVLKKHLEKITHAVK